MCRRPSRRLLVFALAVVARGGPALNLDDDWSAWSAWSNDVSTISLRERDNVLEVAGDLFSKFVTDTYYSEVGLERKLDGIDLSPYAGIEVSYDIRFAYKRDIPRAVDLRLRSLNGSENGDYRSAFAMTPREGVAFVGPFNVTNASSIDLRIIAQPGLFAFRILSIRAVSAVEEDRIDAAPIDGKSPYEVAAYVDKTLNRGQQLASWRDGTMNGPLLVSQANAVYRTAARAVAAALLPALPAPGPTQARNALLRGVEAADARDDEIYKFGQLHSALEAALFAASSANDDDDYENVWPPEDISTPVPTAGSTPAPRPIYDDDGGEKKYKTGFRFARCDGGSSRCILMIIYFVLLAASFCLCGFCLRDFCRQYWNRRKTIPYTDEDPVPGALGDAAAPPDAVENAAEA